MKIGVNLISGMVYNFEVDVERPSVFLNKIRPTEIFQRPVHQILGELKTVSINPECIEWIEFDSEEMPAVGPFAKTMTARQLSAESFKGWVEKNKKGILATMEKQDSNVLLAYGMATFKSGHSLYMEIRATVAEIDRVKTAQKIFSLPAMFLYGEASGLFLINTRNIATWQVVPGLKKSTAFSVPGELTSVRKA